MDLPNQTIVLPDGSTHSFAIDPYRKTCLMEGMDDLDYLLSHMEEIRAYDEKQKEFIFFDTNKI